LKIDEMTLPELIDLLYEITKEIELKVMEVSD